MTKRKQGVARKTGGKNRNTLKTVANKAVKENANTIANCLTTSAKKGHLKSAHLLMELADGNEGVKEQLKERPILTLAARLAGEPQWPIDVPERDWDTEIDAQMDVEDRDTVTA